MIKADWYDPANDSYNLKLHSKLRDQGARILAWDLDFNRDLEQMAGARVDGIVTDSLQEMLDRKTILLSL